MSSRHFLYGFGIGKCFKNKRSRSRQFLWILKMIGQMVNRPLFGEWEKSVLGYRQQCGKDSEKGKKGGPTMAV